MSDRIPLNYSVIGQSAGTTQTYERRIGSDGTVERIHVFYPSGTQTDLRVEPILNDTPIMQAEQTDDSADMSDGIIGSNVTRELDTMIPVETGDKLGFRVENKHGSDDLDLGIAAILDTRNGTGATPIAVSVDRVQESRLSEMIDEVLRRLGVRDGE